MLDCAIHDQAHREYEKARQLRATFSTPTGVERARLLRTTLQCFYAGGMALGGLALVGGLRLYSEQILWKG